MDIPSQTIPFRVCRGQADGHDAVGNCFVKLARANKGARPAGVPIGILGIKPNGLGIVGDSAQNHHFSCACAPVYKMPLVVRGQADRLVKVSDRLFRLTNSQVDVASMAVRQIELRLQPDGLRVIA